MSVTISCPNLSQLQDLIENALPQSEEVELTIHLDQCDKCQRAIEMLASRGNPINSLTHLDQGRISATSAFWPAVRRIEDEFDNSKSSSVIDHRHTPKPTQTPNPEAIKPEETFPFFDPSEQPGFLGQLDRFRIQELVGRGGMGMVFKVFDACLQRTVALKILDPQLAKNELAQERFCREARSAASVMHENIVTIHHVEHDEAKDVSYIVMQFVRGFSLQDRLDKEGRLPLRDIVRMSRQIASGLSAAHEQHLIHRDIKPGNVLIEQNSGRVLLTDFGLARATEDVKLTQTGFVAGTPLYMSPEQAKGETLDSRTDLFSLGGVMYSMATGKPPFDGSSPYVVLRQVSEKSHRPIHELNGEIPDDLVELIDRLLTKDREKRIQSAQEAVNLLRIIESKLPPETTVKPYPSSGSRLFPRLRRGWWGRYSPFIALTLLILNLSLLLMEWGKITRFTAIGQRGESTLVVQNTNSVEDPGPEPRFIRPGNGGPIWSLHFSLIENVLAIGLDDGSVKVWDTKSGQIRRHIQAHDGPVWSLKFSNDGKQLATASDDGIVKVWNTETLENPIELDNQFPVRTVAFSPDGTKLATGSRKAQITLWDLRTKETLMSVKAHKGTIVALAFSPNGKKLASGGVDRTVKLWDIEHKREITTLSDHKGGIYALAFHPKGEILASGSWDRSIRLWNVETGVCIRTIEGHKADVWSLAFSPNGSKLISGSEDRTVRMWDVETGTQLHQYKGHEGTIYSVSYSPDGKMIASGSRDGNTRIWEVEP
jgi:eukaryotic-like serine/threonine-protein kinase